MPIDLKIAWRNIWRNSRRTLLTVAAIAFACLLLVFMFSFQFGSYETMINASVKINTGHLQIQARGYHDNPEIWMVVPNPGEQAAMLATQPDIEAFTFRSSAFALTSSSERTSGCMVMGIDPAREARVSTLKTLVRKGRFFAAGDYDKALVGRLLARNLKVDVGDELTLLGQGRDGSVAAGVVTVQGIFSTGMDEFDRNVIHIPLRAFDELFFMSGAVHKIVVNTHRLRDVAAVKNRMTKRLGNDQKLAVLDWQELMPGLRQSIQMDLVSGVIFYLILVLVVAFSILNTFLMSIFERAREFGVMMAVGARPGRLIRIVMLESMSLTAVGMGMGIVLGIAVTLYFQVHGIEFSGMEEMLSQYGITGRIYPRLSLLSVLVGPAMVFVVTFFAALYPALKIRRLRPVEALAYI